MDYIKIPVRNIVRRLTLKDESDTNEERRIKLRTIMWKTGLRHRDVAALLEYRPCTVSSWTSEKSDKSIPYHALKRLCVITGFNIETMERKKGRGHYADVAR